jgi:glucose/mannose-6-phosphate isomerase
METAMGFDDHNMAKVLEDFPKQCRQAIELPKGMFVSGEISNIVILGMGGSGIVGDLIKAVLHESKLQAHIVRDYALPGFVDEHSLVFAVSYSGKTEETVAACKEALKGGAKVVGIASGGDILQLCKKSIKIPGELQPRCALGYLFFPILGVLANSQLIEVKSQDVAEMLKVLESKAEYQERARTIVKIMKERTPLIYSSEALKPVAMRWKTQFNENGKAAAFYNTFSEMSHNEICGFEEMRRQQYVVLMLRDVFDHERIQKRMDLVKAMLKEQVDVVEIPTKGQSLLARLFSTIHLGDWVTYYYALDKRKDPTPVKAIEKLKKQMSS